MALAFLAYHPWFLLVFPGLIALACTVGFFEAKYEAAKKKAEDAARLIRQKQGWY